MYQLKRKGFTLVEGIIAISIINIFIILTFSIIKNINKSYLDKINQERSLFILIETFEKIRSGRDTALNRNLKTGWNEFTNKISYQNQYFTLNKADNNSSYVNGQFFLNAHSSETFSEYKSEVAPYINYKTYILAKFETINSFVNKDKVVFDVTVRWGDNAISSNNLSGADLHSISQTMILTNNRIYENLY
jgi:competence protein ComGC